MVSRLRMKLTHNFINLFHALCQFILSNCEFQKGFPFDPLSLYVCLYILCLLILTQQLLNKAPEHQHFNSFIPMGMALITEINSLYLTGKDLAQFS